MVQERLERIESMLAQLIEQREKPYLTISEAAKRIRTSESTMRRWKRDGKGPSYTMVQGRPIYSITKLDEFMQLNQRNFAQQK